PRAAPRVGTRAPARAVPRGVARAVGGQSPHGGGVLLPRHPVSLRAIFFDAGNTLVRIDYAAIAAALAARGVSTTPDDLMRAEWRARVPLDPHAVPTGQVG